VPLRYALRLTLLLADTWDYRFKAASQRFLVRLMEELDVETIDVKKLADAFAHIHDYEQGQDARAALQDVVGQLHRMARRVEIDFDSLAVGARRSRKRSS